MNYETVMEMQRICAGEKCELTRGQIAEETIDIKKETKNLPIDKAQACEAFYEKMRSDASKKSYDTRLLKGWTTSKMVSMKYACLLF